MNIIIVIIFNMISAPCDDDKNHYHNCGRFFHGFETFDHTGNDDGNAATLIKIGLNISLV